MWQPSANITLLKKRARILQIVRAFFAKRDVLEVETPLLCHTSVTDPYIHSIKTTDGYLQTSPEYAMKRLLAAGSGSIYQLCKAFRQGDRGQHHNPEFTMLEWYRVGFNHHQLMDETDTLLQATLNTPEAERVSYQVLFQTHLGIDPHTATCDELHTLAEQQQLQIAATINDCTTWFQLLMSHCIEPLIGLHRPIFIYDFPVAQAALAKISPGNPPVAARFEVYYRGLELANGFHELQNAAEQRRRFENNLLMRREQGLNELPIDEYLLSALEHGLPDCSGVALGFDRLVMLATGCDKISEAMSFDFSRA
jgi:lysyl-tRNA synthetase class 2